MSSSGFSTSSTGWEPPSPEELQRILPQYEITSILGRGGMGAVYKGRQTKLNRNVAIKVLPEIFSKGRDELNFAKRFEQEAQAMAGLDHPAILSVYDFGETPDGLLYFVMEFVDGMDISQYLKHHGGKLPQEHALSITAHVLDALEYAHRQGIVHRDIKPANILLNTEGRVKIADFGLAKRFGDAGDPSVPALTMSNVAVGTPDFVAPEALDGDQVPDHRADLYAVGVMLYQMLTGKLPRGNYLPPSELSPGIDARLDVIVGKAMQSDPGRRYGSAAAVRADLDEVMSQPLAKVEAGAESRVVEAAVPVDTTLKRGAPKREAVPRRREQAAVKKPEKSNRLLLSGIATAVSVLAILGVVAVVKKRGTGFLPVSVEGTTPGDRASSFADKSTVFPADNTPTGGSGKTPAIDLAAATRETPFVNSLGMKFVPVPGTEVLFCIHETRREDFAKFAEENPGIRDGWVKQRGGPYSSIEQHPVQSMSWEQANTFCSWLSKKEGLTYRLPSDREWSVAVGIGDKEPIGVVPEALKQKVPNEFPWGTEWPPPQGAGNYADHQTADVHPIETLITGYTDQYPGTAPVMSFKPNPFGIYDLGGNVWEWCADWADDTKTDRTARGASWLNCHRSYLLSSHRMKHKPTSDFAFFGFRCVLELESPTGEPQDSRPSNDPAGAAPREPWIDGLAAWWGGGKSNESFVRSPDGITRQMSDHATMFALPESAATIKDQAVRATVRLENGADSFSLAVRRKDFPAGKIDNYHAHLSRSGNVVRLARFTKSNHVGFNDFPLPPEFDFDASHTLELRVVRDMLAVFLDGKKLGSRRDSELLSGVPTLSASKGAVIESFEYLNLDR